MTRSRPILFLAASLAVLIAAPAALAQVQFGNLAVLRVGNGTDGLANTGGPIAILGFGTDGTLNNTNAIPATGIPGLQLSGTATSEGALTLTGNTLTFTGYNPGASGFTGSGSLASRTAAQAPRAYGTLNVATGTYTFGDIFAGIGTDYSGNNIRSAVTTAAGVYGAGGVQGTVLQGNPQGTVIQNNNLNTRVVKQFGGDLYYSTAAGGATARGIYRIDGTPNTAVTPTAIVVNATSQGDSAYDFVFSPDGNTLYVADSGAVGVQKFTRPDSASAFTLAYNITAAGNGLTGLAVDFDSEANPIIYAVNPGNLFRYEDVGAGSLASIATAGTNFAFRGLELVPVPEPTTVFGVAVLGLAGVRTVRRRLVRA